MSGASSPHPGRAWPALPGGSRSWTQRTATGVATPPPSDEFEAELARDLAVLIERGLVVPVYDRGTVRYSLAGDAQDAPVYEPT
jgi:hypothetical protein